MMKFCDAGEGADVIRILFQRLGDLLPAHLHLLRASLPIAVHQLDGLRQRLVAFGETLQTFVDSQFRQ